MEETRKDQGRYWTDSWPGLGQKGSLPTSALLDHRPLLGSTAWSSTLGDLVIPCGGPTSPLSQAYLFPLTRELGATWQDGRLVANGSLKVLVWGFTELPWFQKLHALYAGLCEEAGQSQSKQLVIKDTVLVLRELIFQRRDIQKLHFKFVGCVLQRRHPSSEGSII